MNESPTRNSFKHSQVPADIAGGPASTTGDLLGPLACFFCKRYVNKFWLTEGDRWAPCSLEVQSNVFTFLNLSFMKRTVVCFGTNLIKPTKLSTKMRIRNLCKHVLFNLIDSTRLIIQHNQSRKIVRTHLSTTLHGCTIHSNSDNAKNKVHVSSFLITLFGLVSR